MGFFVICGAIFAMWLFIVCYNKYEDCCNKAFHENYNNGKYHKDGKKPQAPWKEPEKINPINRYMVDKYKDGNW